MILTTIIYIISILFSIVALLLPSINIIPNAIFESVTYFIEKLLELNSVFLIVDNLMIALVFLMKFFVYFLTYKLFTMLVNYIRGAEGLN